MKRICCGILAAALVLGLCACSSEKTLEGRVTELQMDADGVLTSFVLEDGGKRTGVLLAEGTHIWPRGEGSWTGEELRKEIQVDVLVRANCYNRRESLETAEDRVPAYWAQHVQITGGLEREVRTLEDGTPVDRVETEYVATRWAWQLADGTELLQVEDFPGPEDYYVMGLENFDSLGEEAQEAICAYYQERGLLFDEGEELERAYAAWQEEGEDFQYRLLSQSEMPSASNARVRYFSTNLTLPVYHGDTCTAYEIQLGEAFDPETGEKLSNWDLFAASEAEVRRRLAQAGGGEDAALTEELAEALDPDWIVFTPEGLTVTYPPETLASHWDHTFLLYLEYGEAPEGFFQPWAIPDGGIQYH